MSQEKQQDRARIVDEWKQRGGLVRGRAELERFLVEGARRRPNELVPRFRTHAWFANASTLASEHPGAAPGGLIAASSLLGVARPKLPLDRAQREWTASLNGD